MSTLMDGINSAYALTKQINGLRSVDIADLDPEAIRYSLEKSFNEMLNDMVSSINDNDDGDEEKNDIFGSIVTYNQNYVENLISQATSDDSAESSLAGSLINLNSGSTSYLDSLYSLTDNPLALQGYLDLGSLV